MRAEFYTLFQALIALILGGLLGWEREQAGKWAGLRTHMLVCLGALLFVKLGQFLILNAQATMSEVTLRTDPVRIIEAIMTGVAFLGAGTIFRDPDYHRAHGLTTAASLLIAAPIGIAVAIERYILAVGITLLALFVLRIVRRLEPRPVDAPNRETLPERNKKTD
jgi:putative Mg2+ transporter-C (MgtC) family protein